MVLEVKAALNLEVVLNLPACGKPVGRPLPALGQSSPLHIVVWALPPRGNLAEGNLFQINRSRQQSHVDLIIYRDCLSCAATTSWGCPRATVAGGRGGSCCLKPYKKSFLVYNHQNHTFISHQIFHLFSGHVRPLTVENFGC